MTTGSSVIDDSGVMMIATAGVLSKKRESTAGVMGWWPGFSGMSSRRMMGGAVVLLDDGDGWWALWGGGRLRVGESREGSRGRGSRGTESLRVILELRWNWLRRIVGWSGEWFGFGLGIERGWGGKSAAAGWKRPSKRDERAEGFWFGKTWEFFLKSANFFLLHRQNYHKWRNAGTHFDFAQGFFFKKKIINFTEKFT